MQLAYVEFNEFNEFMQSYGYTGFNEPLIENDNEAILEHKLNVSFKNYKVTKKDYFMGCPSMLTSEKAALALANSIYMENKEK